MPGDKVSPNRDALQFDRVVGAGAPDDASRSAGVVCANCGTAIATEYFHVGAHPVCAPCRDLVQASVATPRGWGALVKAAVYGVGAAIAGAIIYYAVIAITGWQIGIVAILIGYMVGYMVRKGAGGKGGRRFQIVALVLTYWSVGLAYSPMALEGDAKDEKNAVSQTDSSRAAPRDSSAAVRSDSSITSAPAATTRNAKATPHEGAGRVLLVGIGAILLLTFVLPVLMVVGSLPSGLISAIIIFIGLRQAWRMTAAPVLSVSGPYKVGAGPSSAPA
jgi:hypothetical protein